MSIRTFLAIFLHRFGKMTCFVQPPDQFAVDLLLIDA
jgi:hypothetical protein